MIVRCMLLVAVMVLPSSGGPIASSARADDIVIHAANLYTGTGDVLSPGSVLVRDGRIAEVADAIDAGDRTVLTVESLMPGLVDATATTGLADRDAERTEEITPDVSTLPLVDWRDRGFREALAQGTTTLHLVPGTQNVIAGTACVVKSTATEHGQRVVAPATGLYVSLCEDPTSGNRSRSRPDSIYNRQPTNRMGVIWIWRSELSRAAMSEDGIPQLQQVLQGDVPVFCVSRTVHDIRAALSVADEFEIQPVIVGGHEAWRCVDELAGRNTAIVMQRIAPWSSRGDERTETCAETTRRLAEAGIPFCLSEGNLLDQARFAVRFGLDESVALQAITSAPARILKIDDRVGSIATGRDADFVALTGDPFEFTTAIDWVMVDGVLHDQQETGR